MKNALKMMALAMLMFVFSANVGATTLGVSAIAKTSIYDQDGNGGVKVKKSCDKDGDKKECSKDGKKKSCCKKDGKEADKKECSKDGKTKSCCKKEGAEKFDEKKAE